MWISLVGGKLKVYSALPRAAVGLGEARAEAEDPVGARALVVDELRAPEARHAEDQRMVVGQRALAHQRVRDRQRQVLGELAQLGRPHRRAGCRRRRRAAASSPRAAGGRSPRRSPRRARASRSALVLAAARSNSATSTSFEKMSIGTSTSTGPGPAALGQRERLFDDLGEEVRRVDAPRALDERPVDLVLRRVRVQVHFLVRVLAVVVRRHVAGDHHHRDRVERGVGHAGRGVGEPGRRGATARPRPCFVARA